MISKEKNKTVSTSSVSNPLLAQDLYMFPASLAQQRLWFLDRLEPQSTAYNIPACLGISIPLDVGALEQSLNALVQRHEVLRTSFVAVDGQPMQVIAPALKLPLPLVDLSALPNAEREAEALRLANEQAQRPFDLTQGPLLRVLLLQLRAQEYLLVLTMHHIISDGWSLGVLYKELATLYTAFANGQPSPLPDLPIQYADYALWQHERVQGDLLADDLAYWKKQLAGAPALLDLPTDRPHAAVPASQGSVHFVTLPSNLTEALKALSRVEGVTLYMTLVAAFQILLYRYSGQDDIVLGAFTAGRTRMELEALVGFFVNTLVLRTDLSGNPTFRELLGRVRQVTLEAQAHQEVPFDSLVRELHPTRALGQNPLFQVMLVLQPPPPALPAGWEPSKMVVETGAAKFDLALDLADRPEGLSCRFEYRTDLFGAETIARMTGHWQTLLEGIVADPSRPIAEVLLLTEVERQQLLVEWNETSSEYPKGQCIHHLFEAQVERTPDAVAVVFEGEQVTYREVNRRANQLAHYLRKVGIGPEVLVGICVERSIAMVVGLLGILKAGGAYVPLDPSYPAERLAFMLEDSQAPVLLTQARMSATLPAHQAQVIRLDADWEHIAHEDRTNPISDVTSDNLAYVIYTSGSTGKPKGAMISHRGLVNYLTWCLNAYDVAAGRGAPVHSSISFDLTITSLFPPLLVGKSIMLLREDQGLEALCAALRSGGDFSLVKITPAHLELLTEQLLTDDVGRSTRAFIIGGEALSGESLTFWQTRLPGTRLVNEYGPTETVVGCCIYEVPAGTSISGEVPIGRPIANTQLYLLDRYLQPTPIGIPGELYIGGDGVARGYLNRPELTAERFIPDPFSDKAGARLYKTGDLARYRSDGNLEFLGRLDHQVKIRGFRIELGEIETVLKLHPAVLEVLVLAREDVPGDKRLVAYVVLREQQTATVSDLQSHVMKQVPAYMVPSAFVLLEALPMTPNGKVDRRALPALDTVRREQTDDYVAPLTPAEEILASIWAQVLHLERVGIHDNFFDLGGHSLLATQAITRLRNTFQIELPFITIFRAPTIAELTVVIEEMLMDELEELDEEEAQRLTAK